MCYQMYVENDFKVYLKGYVVLSEYQQLLPANIGSHPSHTTQHERRGVMFAHKKIIKEKGADPEPFEVDVAQAICDLEANSNDLKAELRELYIVAAKEVDVTGRKAVVIFVPFKLLKIVHKIQSRLVRELEKKFSGKHVVIIGQRRIMRKPSAGQRQPKQKRPRSRTLTAVHEAILEDLVYPTEVVGKHTRYRLDGSKIIKVYLDPKEAPNVEYKVDTFATVYKKLTGKEVKFEFPVQESH